MFLNSWGATGLCVRVSSESSVGVGADGGTRETVTGWGPVEGLRVVTPQFLLSARRPQDPVEAGGTGCLRDSQQDFRPTGIACIWKSAARPGTCEEARKKRLGLRLPWGPRTWGRRRASSSWKPSALSMPPRGSRSPDAATSASSSQAQHPPCPAGPNPKR